MATAHRCSTGSTFTRAVRHPAFERSAANSGFDVPNTFDTIDQDQHQNIATLNIAPGYSRVIGSNKLLTANAFVRRDHLTYDPSPNPLDDARASISQDRTLTNLGVKADLAVTPVNTTSRSAPISPRPGCTNSSRSASPIQPTEHFWGRDGKSMPSFAPYDLTHNGAPLAYDQAATIKQQAAYVQDDIASGPATFKLGVRLDHYDGLTTKTLAQPRLGVSFAVPGSGTVLRASYGRTMETPYNENLLLSAGVGLNGLFGDGAPVLPGNAIRWRLGCSRPSEDGSLWTSAISTNTRPTRMTSASSLIRRSHSRSRGITHG